MYDRKVMVRYSDDGGYNWSNWKERSLGETGEYMKKIVFTRGGEFIHRTYQIAVSSPVKRDFLTANANLIGRTG
jgi:Neuraminidase (sialidase)